MVIILLALVAVVAAATMRGGPDVAEHPEYPPVMPHEIPEQSSPPTIEQNTYREPEQDIFMHGYLGIHAERIAVSREIRQMGYCSMLRNLKSEMIFVTNWKKA